MVAARDIEAGEVIFREEPLLTGPNHDAKPCCLDCMRRVGGLFLFRMFMAKILTFGGENRRSENVKFYFMCGTTQNASDPGSDQKRAKSKTQRLK